MEPINPYAVVRNCATYEAYRAYVRNAYRAGEPFITLGVLLMLLMPGTAVLMGDHALYRLAIAWKWSSTAVTVSLGLAGLCMGIGFLRMAKYRRAHPIPEEWRQIPGGRPPLSPDHRRGGLR